MLKSVLLPTCAGISLLSLSFFNYAQQIEPRHGYVDNPPSRALLCTSNAGNKNKDCGAASYEPQSFEAQKGFPEKGPADGKIASAEHDNFTELDAQTSERWYKTDLKTGKHDFAWTLTAPHKTEKWRFFITKKDWKPNEKLSRAQFDLTKPICEQNDNGGMPDKTVTIKGCEIPSDYSGYHVILGVWDIADTDNAFYQVSDVNVKP